MFFTKIVNCFYAILELFFVWFNKLFSEKGVIVMFHHVTNEKLLNEIPACLCRIERFKEIIEMLKNDYQFVGIDSVYEKTERKKAIITFDDGWLDAYINAYPLLKQYEIPFTVYLTSNFIGKEGYIGKNELEVYNEDPLVTIGFHTQSHTKLRYETNFQKEIFMFKKNIENEVGKSILFFAYPYGKLYSIGLHSILFTRKTNYENAVGTIDAPLTCFSMLFRYYLPRKVIY